MLDAQLGAAAQQANYMQLYPSYVSQIQQLQQLQYGGGGIPLNCGVSYRVRGTNINVAGQYQQGKATHSIAAFFSLLFLSLGQAATALKTVSSKV